MNIGWISARDHEPDHRGPIDRLFTPFGDPAGPESMLDRLRSVVLRSPDAVAIEDARGSCTYSQLWDALSSLACAIEAKSGEAPVGVLLVPGRDYVVAVYACLAARRIAVPLDLSFPESRNRAIAHLTGMSLVITHDRALAAAWTDVEVLSLTPEIADTGSERVGLDIDAPAFILCTSGSTGTPKPIVHSQRTLLHWARTSIDALRITTQDRVLSLSSPSAIGGFVPLMGFPLTGATVQTLDIKAGGISGLFEVLEHFPITILRAAPSLFRGLAQVPEAADAFARLRAVQTYGEALTIADVGLLRGVLPAPCLIRSAYGSTEAVGFSWFARPGDAYDAVHTPAGLLMPDTDALIVDDAGSACARGDVGELIIRSRYNALGEWLDGRVVPGRLEPDPQHGGRRLYRTGDLARCDADGVFVVLGRKDRMLNINGQRVEPAEVERVIRTVPDVRETEVLPFSHNGVTKMTAFVVARTSGTPNLEAIVRTALRASLPSYMMPSKIAILKTLPRLPGGKVDAQALFAAVEGRA